ncbi:MAG: FAD-dependent oxidoreductase [Candidatus Riflebacteria bacterium]|nr:FAD-dependent oxidoreductase [Candidatus Riflebacteria bacterium]
MKLLLRQIEVSLEYDQNDVFKAIIRKLGCGSSQIINHEIVRRSLDSRPGRSAPAFVLTVEVQMAPDFAPTAKLPRDTEVMPAEPGEPDNNVAVKLSTGGQRPVVVGAGPAGLMAAYHLAAMGARPLLIERGSRAEDRRETVDGFWRNGSFDPENNVLFGEGGAGLFSDGKLTARSKDRPRIRQFFQTLVESGAPADILIDAEPHLGSDILLRIVPEMRRRIESAGGEIRYNTALTDIIVENNAIAGIKAGDHEIQTSRLILATGHSARDVYRLLGNRNATLQAKPFAVGVRLEIPQKQINQAQYGKFAGHPRLGAASFKLTRRPEGAAKACYSFCMCPGGLVIACASENGALTTNGMSYSQRGSIFGNAAFIVPVEPEDYAGFAGPESHPELAGLNFQLAIEKAAFAAGGGGFMVPALMFQDFIYGKVSKSLPAERSCPRSQAASFDDILPDFVTATLRAAMPKMLRELNGITPASAILYAAETRSSSPVRVVRDENGESPAISGLFPAGEGAGYAGGIVSSAVDGLKAAEQVLTRQDKH